ncbi:MAG: hypothetical protein K2N14_05090 [Clostridia bacterium]|nr:hypothetical protein [Clostridia bacterium]
MTAKQFFKSTAFKCIAVLLSIILVCGILLTICNSLFYVSDEERFERAINKIYGKSVQTESVLKDSDEKDFGTATVLEAYQVKDDGNYLVKVTGKQGFDNGTVTCWVVVKMTDGKVAGIDTVKIDSNTSQSYIGNIDAKELAQFSKIEYTDGFVYELGKDGKDYIPTGASVSMIAISNSVNGAITYVNRNVLGQSAPKDPLEGLEYTANINGSKTSYEVIADNKVKFTVTTKGNGNSVSCGAEITVNADGVIEEYKLTKNGADSDYKHYVEELGLPTLLNGKGKQDILAMLGTADGSYDNASIDKETLQTGATESKYLCLYAALFATANYGAVIAGGAQ